MAGAVKFYTRRPMDFAVCTSVTSEASGHPIEHALDRNLFTYWEPTTTGDQAIVIDLQNGLQERITAAADRNFSSDSGKWTNALSDGWSSWAVAGGNLTVQASASNQTGGLASSGMSAFVAGSSYRITYDWSAIGGLTARWQCSGTGQVIGTLTAGSAQTATFTCTGASTGLVLCSTATTGTGVIDNVSIKCIDNESDYAVKAIAIWINNHSAYFDASHGLKLEYSDDNSTWTEVADKDIQDEMTDGVQGDPLRIYVLAASHIHRYWKVTLHSATNIIKIGGIYLLSEFDFGAHSTYPEKHSRSFWNSKGRLDGGMLALNPGGRTPIYGLSRSYRFAGTTSLGVLQNAFTACRGGQTPIILNEGSDYWLVNVLTDTLDISETDYHYYSVSLDYETLPYIMDGNTI